MDINNKARLIKSLPEEVVRMIVWYIGGRDFVSLRRVCLRLKMICDDIEMGYKLWWRFACHDFPAPILQSAVAGLSQWSRSDDFAWKQLCVRLSNLKALRRGTHVVSTHLNVDKSDMKHFRSFRTMMFLDGKLYCDAYLNYREQFMPVVGLKHADDVEEDNASQKLELSNDAIDGPLKRKLIVSRQGDNYSFSCGQDVYENIYCIWEDRYASTKQRGLVGPRSSEIWISSFSAQPKQVFHVIKDCRERVHQLVFNETQVVALKYQSYPNTNIFYLYMLEPSNTGETTEAVFCERKRPFYYKSTSKLQMCGNLVVSLDGKCLFTNRITRRKNGFLKFGEWYKLSLPALAENVYEDEDIIKDFTIHGSVFAAITYRGVLYVSIMDDYKHKSIEKNFLKPHRILPLANFCSVHKYRNISDRTRSRKQQASTASKVVSSTSRAKFTEVSVDAQDGLKVLVAEQSCCDIEYHVVYYSKLAPK